MSAKQLASSPSARARRLKAIEAVAVMGMTHSEAADYSGLSPGSVSQLLSKPKVKKYIAEMQKKQEEKLNVSRERVLEGMLTAIQDARQLGEPASQIRGWEQIAKMQGYYAPERRVVELPENAEEFVRALQALDSAEVARIAGQDDLIELSLDEYEVRNE